MHRSAAQGFTLIELLIVIAIIGILTSLVLGGVYLARLKAYDNSIRNDIRQLRLIAEEAYDANHADYTDWTLYEPRTNDIAILKEDVDQNFGDSDPEVFQTIINDSQIQDYCVSAPLREGGYYCIDATGAFIRTATACLTNEEAAGSEEPVRCPTS